MKSFVTCTLLFACLASVPLCFAYGPDEWPLETILGESQRDTIVAIRQELQPIADSLFQATGLDSDCVGNAVGMLGGCWGDAVAFVRSERDNIMNLAGQNPLIYLQPTSQSLIQAADEDMEGRTVNLSEGCCASFTTLSDEGCLCSSQVIDIITGITGQSFVDTLQASYLSSCNAELTMYPSLECDALSASTNGTTSP